MRCILASEYQRYSNRACSGRNEVGEWGNIQSAIACQAQCNSVLSCVSVEWRECCAHCQASSSCTYAESAKFDNIELYVKIIGRRNPPCLPPSLPPSLHPCLRACVPPSFPPSILHSSFHPPIRISSFHTCFPSERSQLVSLFGMSLMIVLARKS